MMLGFISLVLTVIEDPVSEICGACSIERDECETQVHCVHS